MRQHFGCAALWTKRTAASHKGTGQLVNTFLFKSVFQWKFGTLTEGFSCLRKAFFHRNFCLFSNLKSTHPDPGISMGTCCCRASRDTYNEIPKRMIQHLNTSISLLQEGRLCRASFSPTSQPDHQKEMKTNKREHHVPKEQQITSMTTAFPKPSFPPPSNFSAKNKEKN